MPCATLQRWRRDFGGRDGDNEGVSKQYIEMLSLEIQFRICIVDRGVF